MSDKAFGIEDVQRKRTNRMDHIDSLSPEMRKVVHDYGFNVVNNFMMLGVSKPKHIRHLVETVLDEFSPTRGCYAKQGIRTNVDGRTSKPPLEFK